jgi:predicted Zn-dependent protease
MRPAARALLAVAALLVVAWLAVGLRTARLEESGAAVAVGPAAGLSPGRVARAQRDLRDASSPFADHDAELYRARLLERTRRPAAAVSILRALVREEPENVLYWEALARAAARVDPVLARQARARVAELNPRAR